MPMLPMLPCHALYGGERVCPCHALLSPAALLCGLALLGLAAQRPAPSAHCPAPPALYPGYPGYPARRPAAAAQRAPSTQAPRPAPCPCPWPGSRPYCQHRTQTPIPGEVPLTPLILICTVSTRHQKFRLCLFVPRKTPAWNTPPASTLPKNFLSKNPACVAGSIRAAGDGSGGPLGAPFASRGGFVSGPVRRNLSFRGEVWGRNSGGRWSRRYRLPSRRPTPSWADFFPPSAPGVSTTWSSTSGLGLTRTLVPLVYMIRPGIFRNCRPNF